jgi:hypothetical protein
MKFEWKKSEKNFYQPGIEPEFIKVPPFSFFLIEGNGDPNDKSFGEYISILYSLSYAVKMSSRNGLAPKGYFEYTVYPLEGIWDISEEAKKLNHKSLDKSTLVFKLMIRQPAFVTNDFAKETIERTRNKKPHPLFENAIFKVIEDGDCVQMLHRGSYNEEPESFRIMENYCMLNGYARQSKIHREIYLSDARKVSPEKLKTVLRFSVSKQ